MNKLKLKHLIIFCSVLFLILASITCFVIVNDKKFDNFYLGIYEVDKNINSQFYLQAGELLSSLYSDIFNTKTALIFLKRAEKIASATDDFREFAFYSEGLSDKFSSNIELAAVCSYAMLMNSEYKKSLDISQLKLRKSIYKKLYLLNVIKNNAEIYELNLLEEFKEEFGFLFSDNINSEMLSLAAEKHRDERYIVDQALFLLKEGEVNAAQEILNKTTNGSYSELKLFASYDSSDYLSAEKYFHQIQEQKSVLDEKLIFTGCDILMKNGKYQDAANLYTLFIQENPEKYSLPYRNLFSINKNSPTAVNWLSDGLSYFPESEELLIPSAWLMYINNNYEDLKKTMLQLETSNDNTIAELFKVSMMFAGRSPEHIIGNFWNVYNSDPQSEPVAISFANYLLQNKQYTQLALFVNKYHMYNKPTDWVFMYSAIGKAMTGKLSEALLDIDSALEISDNYINNFNKAVILELSGDSDNSLNFLGEALQKAEQNDITDTNLSKIYFKIADVNYKKNNYQDAYYNIQMAIDLEPDKMKNKLMLRQIKEEYND